MSIKEEVTPIKFLGIGVMRGGSTWIYKNLQAHPEICISRPKETRFFSDETKYEAEAEFYNQCFSHCSIGKVKGEFDPNYLNDAQTARRIHVLFPNIKFILIFRNPITRAYSHYNTHYFKGKTWHSNFGTAIREPRNIYVKSSKYASLLKPYLKLFKKEQFLFLFHEDIKNDPQKIMQRVYNFLDVDSSFVSPFLEKEINYTGISRAKIPFVNPLIRAAEASFIKGALSPLKGIFKALRIHMLAKKVLKLNFEDNIKKGVQKAPKMESGDREFLHDLLKEDVQKLSEMIGDDCAKKWDF